MATKTLHKEVRLEKISEDKLHNYLVNRTKQTAIKIPNEVEKTLTKFRNPNHPASILASDILTFAIYGDRKGIKGARKLVLSSLTNPLLDNYFEGTEVRELLNFLLDCPEGYEFTYKPVFAHIEIEELKRL
ncbi:hypothetical protein [Brevibacillus sp. NRS-1366]|uniref:hypothetical protein n=1 Tax=Brevibacillus sp. NRS-1366 TaxID=3233899 RepID=UPI003D1E0E94